MKIAPIIRAIEARQQQGSALRNRLVHTGQHCDAMSGDFFTQLGIPAPDVNVMGVPCITLRNTTERPETVTIGRNELIGTDAAGLKPALDKLFARRWKKGAIPPLWDGHTGERIAAVLELMLAT
jgi:UDP-N-acetylglucosamine 2-epimerase